MGALRVEVRDAAGGGALYWLRTLLAVIGLGYVWTGIEDADAPAVVVRGDSDYEAVLLRTGTAGQARRAAARYAGELEELGAVMFCQKYGLPS